VFVCGGGVSARTLGEEFGDGVEFKGGQLPMVYQAPWQQRNSQGRHCHTAKPLHCTMVYGGVGLEVGRTVVNLVLPM
jgi:hypothetical protein